MASMNTIYSISFPVEQAKKVGFVFLNFRLYLTTASDAQASMKNEQPLANLFAKTALH